MNNTYVQFDTQTGAYLGCMTCSEHQAVEQTRSSDTGMLKVRAAPLSTGLGQDGQPFFHFDWEIIRTAVAEDIDAKAEAFCQSYVTPGETQVARYMRKEAEARAWLLDNSAAIPMIAAEAAATGTTVADLVNLIIAKAEEWVSIMAAVESKRLAAKQSLAALTNIGEMAAVAEINWLN